MKRGKSYNERIVNAFFKEHGIPAPVYELQFAPPRRWRFDLAWPGHKLAIEAQGGLFVGGAHVRGAFLRKEHEKRNHAAAMGWRILYFEPMELCMVQTVLFIKQSFGWL